MRIPHVLCTTHKMMTGRDSPANVEAPQNSDKGRKKSLAGNQQRLPEPQPETSNHHANVAQVQHVLPAPGPRVEREPGQHPDKRRPAGDRKRLCIRWHVLMRTPNPPKRTTGSNMELGQFLGRFEHNPSMGMRARQTKAVEQLLGWLQQREDQMAALLADLIAIPTENPPGRHYREFVEVLEKQTEKLGWEFTRLGPPSRPGAR